MAMRRFDFGGGIHSCFGAPPYRSSPPLGAPSESGIAHGGVRPTAAQ
jgi:hypothetical protein